MTEELIHELLRRQDTFSEQLGAFARNQDTFSEQLGALARKQDTFSEQLGALARNQEASAEEHRELVGFLGQKFGRIDRHFEAIDRRFEAIDRRFVKLEVGLEGVRDEVRILAEGIAGTNQRLDRFQERLEHLEAG